MKQRLWFVLVMILVLTSVLLDACSFSVQVIPSIVPPPPTLTVAPDLPTVTPVPPTAVLASATPTLLPITSGTTGSLEIFMTLAQGELPRSLAFTPDNTVLAAAGGDTKDFGIHLWNLETGESLGTLDGHRDIVWGIAFSPDGQLLASVSRDATARIWDWRGRGLLKTLEFPGDLVSVSFSPDGRTLAVGGVDKAQDQIQYAAIWTYAVDAWRPLVKFPEYIDIGAMAYTPDGRFLVGGGTSYNVQVWRTGDGTPIFTLNHSHQVADIAVAPDGSRAATATCQVTVGDECVDGSVWLWNLSNGRLIVKLDGFPDVVESVAFSADGSSLIAASRRGLLRVYAVNGMADYQPVFESTPAGGNGVLALSPDGGLLATATGDGHIYLWKVVSRP